LSHDARKNHTDEFGKEIHAGEVYFSRSFGIAWGAEYKVSKESMDTLFMLLFGNHSMLNEISSHFVEFNISIHAEREDSEAEKQRKEEYEKLKLVHPRLGEWTNLKNDELRTLVWSKSTVAIANEFGISDVAIAKRCKKNGIVKPPRGFWAKVESGKVMHPNGIPFEPTRKCKVLTVVKTEK